METGRKPQNLFLKNKHSTINITKKYLVYVEFESSSCFQEIKKIKTLMQIILIDFFKTRKSLYNVKEGRRFYIHTLLDNLYCNFFYY